MIYVAYTPSSLIEPGVIIAAGNDQQKISNLLCDHVSKKHNYTEGSILIDIFRRKHVYSYRTKANAKSEIIGYMVYVNENEIIDIQM